ncbi:hypothetical protein ABIA28_007586 [Bradyrhizobium elkanii]
MAEKAARADALESEVADLKACNADADARIERLTQILKAFDRARFGRRSKARLCEWRRRTASLCLRGDRDRHRCDQGPGQQGPSPNIAVPVFHAPLATPFKT